MYLWTYRPTMDLQLYWSIVHVFLLYQSTFFEYRLCVMQQWQCLLSMCLNVLTSIGLQHLCYITVPLVFWPGLVHTGPEVMAWILTLQWRLGVGPPAFDKQATNLIEQCQGALFQAAYTSQISWSTVAHAYRGYDTWQVAVTVATAMEKVAKVSWFHVCVLSTLAGMSTEWAISM